jgi:serine/threonine-protein kinase
VAAHDAHAARAEYLDVLDAIRRRVARLWLVSCPTKRDLFLYQKGEAPQLARHIETCVACRDFIRDFGSAGTAVASSEPDRPESPDMPDTVPGAVVADRFVVTQALGEGTFGVVVRARDRETDIDVALKLLRPAFRGGEALTRFEREARLLAELHSPRFCRIVAAGTSASGTPYIATELLRGHTLGDELRRHGRLPVAVAAAHVIAVCEGLGEIHARQIVHRDLKPDNIFLAEDSSGETVQLKILDLGVARTLLDPSLTGTGAMIGTPYYMAPEQLRGSRDVGAPADIWALGAILQELVMGTPAFAGTSLGDVTTRILRGQRGPLDDAAHALAPVLDRCLAVDVQARFASGTEMALALAPFVSSPSPPQEIPKAVVRAPAPTPARRRARRSAIVGSSLVAAVAVAGLVWLHPWSGARTTPSVVFDAGPAAGAPGTIEIRVLPRATIAIDDGAPSAATTRKTVEISPGHHRVWLQGADLDETIDVDVVAGGIAHVDRDHLNPARDFDCNSDTGVRPPAVDTAIAGTEVTFQIVPDRPDQVREAYLYVGSSTDPGTYSVKRMKRGDGSRDCAWSLPWTFEDRDYAMGYVIEVRDDQGQVMQRLPHPERDEPAPTLEHPHPLTVIGR